MVPADGNFTTSLAKGDHKTGEVKGQTREHARLINLLGVKQLIVGVNKMDSDTAGYKEERYNEIRDEVRNMLVRVGWNKKFVDESVPIVPISGWVGDNLFKKSEKMTWWNGVKVKSIDNTDELVITLHDALNSYAKYPKIPIDKALRMPVSGVHNIKGVGDVITGKIEQGSVKPGAEVIFLPSHTAANQCAGKIFSIEMHHKSIGEAVCGDNVGLCIKGLNKDYRPQVGDVMILKTDKSLGPVKNFTVQVQVLDHPGELKPGYCPIVHCRTAKAPCKLIEIKWKMGKETGNQKLENPPNIKANEMGCLVFEVNPKHPIIVDSFNATEVLGRIAIMEGNSAVMLGKVTAVERL
jgi:elongation factor 1-alpha